MSIEQRVAALEEALADAAARSSAHTLIFVTLLNNLRITTPGAYIATKVRLAGLDRELTRTNEPGALLRELRFLVSQLEQLETADNEGRAQAEREYQARRNDPA